ncbi:MAG TPA: NADH-quinone oxidoreductase subunit N [Flavobacterium sp.]|nr:NADH-quinone oxidoreductase subunit N [Flavobacterium sp.]
MELLITITGIGVLCLLLEMLNLRKIMAPAVILGLIGVLVLVAEGFGKTGSFYNNMIVADSYGYAFTGLFTVLTIFLIALSPNFYHAHMGKFSDFVSIKVFLLAGATAMVTFGNLAMFFLGIEILSIALYVLAASDRLNIRSNEAGLKYFLLGSFASGFILFGICLIYGAVGTFDMRTIGEAAMSADVEAWFYIGIILLTVGLLFKIAAVPFHFWAPDVYQGAPALTTALMSTLAKITAMAAFFKLAKVMAYNLPEKAFYVVIAISILSMTVGNIMALRQVNVKRMLAFSGISHAGFMLMTLLNTATSESTLFYYACAYGTAGIAAFSVIIYVCRDHGNEDVTQFHGLGKTSPLMAAVMTGALLSMAGIPVFSGFFGKLMLFNDTLRSGHLALVIVGVVNSIISVGYYFKLILAMYTKEPNEARNGRPYAVFAVGVIALLLNLAIGLFPSLLTDLF